MRLVSCLILLLLSATRVDASTSPFEGRWFGTVEMKDGARVETVIEATGLGNNWVLRLTQPSVDRFHQPIVNSAIDGGDVILSPVMDEGMVTWRGEVSADGSTFRGEIVSDGATQGTFALVNRPAVEGPGVDIWSGSVIVPGRDFERVRLRLLRKDDRWHADVDLPDRKISRYPADVREADASLSIDLPFDIQLRLVSPTPLGAEGQPEQVMAAWREGDLSTALMMRRQIGDQEVVEPLYPQAPGSRTTHVLRIEDIAHPIGHQLGVTFTAPAGDGPFPAVVLVPGIGGRDRDDRSGGHQFQAVWADALARRGIASVRFDDRGVGRSTLPEGIPHYGPSIRNETMDVRHLVEWLAAQPTVDPAAVGIVGWDTGGWVAANTAAGLHREVAFIVLLSMPGLPLAEVMSAQLWQQLAAAPVDQEQARSVLRVYRTLLDVGQDPRASEEELRELVVKYLAAHRQLAPGNQRPVSEQEIAEGLAAMASPAMRRNLRFEPRMILPRLRCPVLAVGGTADVDVPSAVHLPEIEAAVQRTGGEIELVDIENVNHRLQPSDPGKVVDSSRIRATVDPRAMRAVTDWIQAVAGPVPPPAEAQDQ